MATRPPINMDRYNRDGQPQAGGAGARLTRTLLMTVLFAGAFMLAFHFLRTEA